MRYPFMYTMLIIDVHYRMLLLVRSDKRSFNTRQIFTEGRGYYWCGNVLCQLHTWPNAIVKRIKRYKNSS